MLKPNSQYLLKAACAADVSRQCQPAQRLPFPVGTAVCLGEKAADAEQEKLLALLGDYYPEPNDHRGYIAFEICRALPSFIGPEMHGDIFGFHPRVLARSWPSLLYQQVNLEHKLIANDTARYDRIVGTVIDVMISRAPTEDGEWPFEVPTDVEAAPFLTVVAVVHKQAGGALTMLSGHASQRRPRNVSIEVSAFYRDGGVFVPQRHAVMEWEELDPEMAAAITQDPRSKRMRFGKYRGEQLVYAMGGVQHAVDFSGVGVVDDGKQAERRAKVIEMRACQDGYARMAASQEVAFLPGMRVSWGKQKYAGEILSVHPCGMNRGGVAVAGSYEAPALIVRADSGREIVVNSAYVRAE